MPVSGGATLPQALGPADSPTFAGATIGGVGVNVATTAATLWVDTTGNDTTGQRGNDKRKFLTAQAAYNAAEIGDTIKLGYGTYNVAGVADKTVLWIGTGYEAFTALNLTYSGAQITLPDGMAFTDLYDVEIGVTTSSPTFALPPTLNCRNSTVVITIATSGAGVALDLANCVSTNYGFGGLNLYNIDTGATTTGAMTIKGGTTAGATLNGAASGTEVYLIGLSGSTAIHSDAGTTKGGTINADGCYDVTLTAATVRMGHTTYNALDYTTLANGGGNRDETVNISNAVVSTTASGTAYALTNSYAALDFGTTDPIITLPQGTWLLYANIQTKYNGATFAGLQTESFKLRRTNNTAADVDTERSAPLAIVTALTENGPAITLGPVPYTSTNADDSLTIFGIVSTTPGAGSMQVINAVITAIKL